MMNRMKQLFAKKKAARAKKQEKQSKRIVLDELFEDLYNDRRRIYKMNFVRGILFGLGSAIGGTIAIALIVWLLSVFVNLPLLGQLFENAQQSIEQTTEQTDR